VPDGLNQVDEPGFLPDTPDVYGQSYTTRQLNALSYRALHLLVRLSLFCNALLQYGGLDKLVRGQGDAAAFCWTTAVRDLPLVHRLLNGSNEEEACAWLHDLIERLPQWGGGAVGQLASQDARQHCEASFAQTLVGPHSTVAAARACLAARPMGAGPRPLLHRVVDEDAGVDAKALFFPGLMSTVERPSVEGLEAAFARELESGRKSHPFLALVLAERELLSISQHLWPFVQWERMLREHWSTHLERSDAREMSVRKLLEQTQDSSLRESAEASFELFAASWNALIALLREGNPRATQLCAQTAGRLSCQLQKKLERPQDLIDMTLDAPLTLGIIDPEICADPGANLFRLFLQVLAKAQSDFLGMVVPMVPTCTALAALSLGGNAIWLDTAPHTPMLELQVQHMLLDNVNDLSTLMLASCLSQKGSGLLFDFASIEENLAARLLTGSRYVDGNAQGMMDKEAPAVFIFKGELLPRHRDLANQVSEQIPQEPVANARSLRENDYLQEPKFCREALELLELVLYNATKTLPGPDERLRKYCEDFDLAAGAENSLRSRVLQCTAIGEVPLKQLRSLFELIESLVADAVLPTLNDAAPRFCEALPSLEIADRACRALGQRTATSEAAAIRAGRLRLEPALKRFIYRELKPSAIISQSKLDSSLFDYVAYGPFPWGMGDEVTDEEIGEAFEDGGLPAFKHAYALWAELRRRGDDGEWVMVAGPPSM